MTSWIDFKDQAVDDLKSSIALQHGNKIGNSAYMLQQSLEKFVKALVLKYNLSNKTPNELSHLPLIGLWNELQNNIKTQIMKTNNQKSIANYALMEKSIKIIGEFFKKSTNTYKELIWKDSLEIELEKNEKNELLNLISDLKQELEPVIKKVIFDYKELFENKLKPFLKTMPPKYRIELQQVLDELDMKIDINNQKIDTTTNISDLIKEIPKFFDDIEHLYYVIRKDPRRKYFLDSDEFLTILLAWTFQFSGIILKTFVHEDIGRYPRTIISSETKNSRTWYKEKGKEVEKLREDVSKACSRLYYIVSKEPIF